MQSTRAPILPFDPADPAFVADPYPVFDELRARAEVHPHPTFGFPVAVSYAACSTILRGSQLQRVWRDVTPEHEFTSFNLLHRNSMLESVPPQHTRLRRLVAGAFNRGHTERLRPTVQAVADRLVDQVVEQIRDGAEADLLTMLAAPLPIEVIAELLGIPAADRALLQPWSNAIVKMYEYGRPPEQRAAAEVAAAEFIDYLNVLVDHRRRHPGDDLVTDLVTLLSASEETGGEDGGHLTADELVGTAALLLMAGHEATVNVLGNGVLALLGNRPQWRRLRDNPSLAGTAVEELIRYDSPLQMFERTAVADVEVGGVVVPAGQKIAALLGAAARDPAMFKNPDLLDIGRRPNPHLGFGAGIHYCLGAPLARVEVQAALEALTTRLPGLRLAGQPTRRAEFVIRGLTSLPVTE